MTVLRLLLSSVLVCESLSSTTSTRINLGPGVYAGLASHLTTPCWPDMTAVALSHTPEDSTVAYTDQDGRSSVIARGRTAPYGRTTFRTKVDPGRCFYIHGHHDFPHSAVETHDRALRIPFCIKDDTLTMYLEARMTENRKVYDLRCPLNLAWVNASRLGTLSKALGPLLKQTRTEASQEPACKVCWPAPPQSACGEAPFPKAGGNRGWESDGGGGMWRIHLGEETVDGLGREVVLPLVDVDDPFDPLD
ncbi:hypothetical protein FOZ60_002253 [Perkinsus olseni]|uniref:Uncharacterized protein n=1 Tax=Perkinsus olseni TaxID=32597 RepID=A0A7J6NYC6_PEROL|nr:hypothetical protein FOZ60_002253 [Perkinsus olseni]